MKKIYSLIFIISITLVAGIIGINSVNAEGYGLYVNGEEFTSEKTTINCGNGTASYNVNTNILTLNNATINKGYIAYEDDDSPVGIFYNKNKNLKIIVQGNSSINLDGYGIGVFGNLTLEGSGLLNIKTFEECINAYNEKKETFGVVSIKSGEFIFSSTNSSVVDASKIDANNYKNTIMLGLHLSGINANVISKNNLSKELLFTQYELYQFLKMGNFKTNKIKTSVNQAGYSYIPKGAYKGEIIAVFDKDLKYYYNLKSIKIYKLSDNSNITKKVGYNSKKYTFVMPDYPIKIVIKLDKKNRETLKPDKLKAKLTSYNSVKLSGKYIATTHDKSAKYDYGVHSGYYIYYKKGNAKKYTYFGKGNEIAVNKYSKISNIKNLKPGKKYTFKVKWFVKIGKYGNADILSNKSKTVTIRTLKKAKTPKVVKEDKKHVKVTVKKVKGATGYKIAVSKNKTKGFKTVATIKGNDKSKVIKAKKGKKLYYKVRAYKKEGSKKIYAPYSKVKAYKLK